VGEIGFDRHEFLYELTFWEIRSIIRGYNARHHAGWEQARLVAYHAHFCMGAKETPPQPEQWYPFSWERPEPIPQDEIDDIQAEMDAIVNNSIQNQ
jgi:hypothetical protein